MTTHNQQQHLRTLRRSLNRAVSALKDDDRVVVSTGWGNGRAFSHPRLTGRTAPWPEAEDLHLLFPVPEEAPPLWHTFPTLVPAELLSALDFFWPGPLIVRVRCPETRKRIHLACPWHPLMRELLSRNGACLWAPLTQEEDQRLAISRRAGHDGESFESDRTLLWPEHEMSVPITYFDATSVPWRLTENGFIEAEELGTRIREPFLLSEERAFPTRALRTSAPQYKTVVLEAASKEELPGLVEQFRSGIRADWSLRIYLDEWVAHNHFPDDRGVRVYGEMNDPERVRRRLEAMLERQRRRSGRRILLIGVAELDVSADSLKADLVKLADRWITVPAHGTLEIDDEFA